MVPDTPPPSLTRLAGAEHVPPPAGRELVRLARSYRSILLTELPALTETKELTALHREALAVEEYVGAAEVRPSARGRALRLLADARCRVEDRMAEIRNRDAGQPPAALVRSLAPIRQDSGQSSDPFAVHLDRVRYCRDALARAFIRDVTARPTAAMPQPRPAVPCRPAELERAAASGVRFGTVYADPPWPYENQASRGATDNHYPTMPLDDIAALPVGRLAAPDAHLHLWATNGFLPEAIELMTGWGFAFKSVFVWVKPQIGLGNYWRVSHEFLLLGVRGRCPFRDRGQASWRVFGRTRHSAKPEAIRRLVERVSPGPYLELFGRSPARDWVVWGNEVGRDTFNESLNAVRATPTAGSLRAANGPEGIAS